MYTVLLGRTGLTADVCVQLAKPGQPLSATVQRGSPANTIMNPLESTDGFKSTSDIRPGCKFSGLECWGQKGPVKVGQAG